MNWMRITNTNILKSRMPFFFTTKMILFQSNCNLWWKIDSVRHSKCSTQWLDADKAQQHFPKPKLHQKKVMVTVWWLSAGLIHHSFIKPGETITAERDCREIDQMHRKLTRKQLALVNRKALFFSMIMLDHMFQWSLLVLILSNMI